MPARSPDGLVSIVESLEPRRLLAVTLELGTLKITGTHKRDRFSITLRSDDKVRVSDNGSVHLFTLGDVERINLQAGQGDDVIDIDNGKRRLTIPTRLYGSGGDDTIVAGRGQDRIYGGAGDDVIRGGNSRDVIYGDGGDDSIDGENGGDVLSGGDGNDTLTGGDAIDRLSGGRGRDHFQIGDRQIDRAHGGAGTDTANADDFLDNLINIENT
jgi:Ca2+-binding RTX toxin-like protein